MTTPSTGYRNIALTIALLVPALLCCSCGKSNGRKPVFRVQGKVLFEGKPLPHAFVVFHPVEETSAQATRPVATAEDDGTFAPTTYEAADGAPAGEYAVTVEWRPPPAKDQVAPSENLLSPRYAKPASTPFKIRILEGTNNLEPFQLKR